LRLPQREVGACFQEDRGHASALFIVSAMGVHLVFNLVSFLALVFIPEWR